MFIAPFVVGPWQTNCYVVATRRATSGEKVPAAVIDPGVGALEVIVPVLDEGGFELAGVICTHGHLDHVSDAATLANDRGVPVWLHPADVAMLTEPALGLGPGSELLIQQLLGRTTLPAPDDRRELSEGQCLRVAGLEFVVTHAPGHTPGCVVLLNTDGTVPVLFSGDVIFAGSIGRVDLPGGSMAQMQASLQRLAGIVPHRARILPGHGPATDMARELATNPYLRSRI